MKRIYKYKLEIRDVQTVALPEGAEMLTVQINHGQACLWAMVDPSKEDTDRAVYCAGTGHNMLIEVGKFLGTVQMQGQLDETYVFHFFEDIQPYGR